MGLGLGLLLDHFGEVGDRTWGVVALDFDLVFLSKISDEIYFLI